MYILMRYAVCAALILSLPLTASAESWVEFHAEKWDYRSEKLRRKLNFKSRSYYDPDSLKRSSKGDAELWVKEVSNIDRYYVGKGNPASEVIFKKMHIWCDAAKYEIMAPDADNSGMSEAMGEEIKPGSLYDKLFQIVCSGKGEKR